VGEALLAFDTRLEEVAYWLAVPALTALLRRVYDTHDPAAGVRALLEISDPYIEMWPAGLWLDDAGVCRGREEVAEFFGRLQDAFGGFHFEPERFEERGDFVAVAVRMEVEGRHSGLSESRTVGHLWRFRDGLAVEIRAFHAPDEAFAALL
jgi:ketosteroid isomerase-like protein